MKIQVSELGPNPFRNIKHYPIDREKVDALKRSIKDTSFWDNLLARPAKNGSSGYELAYGHHRWQALKELARNDAQYAEIDIPVRKLDNTKMAQIMAHENMEEWGHKASIEQETIRSIIEAYGKGEIELPKPKTRAAGVRCAPNFQLRSESSARAEESESHPYTTESLCDFLGWKRYKVDAALGALELIEIGIAEPETFKDLTTRQSQAVTDQTKRVLRDKKEADPEKSAKIVVRGLSAGMRKSVGKGSKKENKGRAEVTIHTAKHKADQLLGRDVRKQFGGKPKGTPDIDKFAMETAKSYGRVFDDREEKMAAIIKHREYLSNDAHKMLIGSLRRVIKDASKFLVKLDPEAMRQTINDMRTSGVLLQLVHQPSE